MTLKSPVLTQVNQISAVKATSQFLDKLREKLEWDPDDAPDTVGLYPELDPDVPETLVGWRIIKIGKVSVDHISDLKAEIANLRQYSVPH